LPSTRWAYVAIERPEVGVEGDSEGAEVSFRIDFPQLVAGDLGPKHRLDPHVKNAITAGVATALSVKVIR